MEKNKKQKTKNKNTRSPRAQFCRSRGLLPTTHYPLPTGLTAGFVTLFAVLVAGLLLAVGISIYDITSKELIFTTVTRDSELAFYAADTGLECALKWDIRYDGAANYRSGSVFATSTHSLPPTAGVLCNGIDVAATPWSIDHTAGAATTTFTVTFLPQNYCAVVTVAKSGYPSLTSVVSRGYNLCDQTASGRVERALQANY